MEVVGDLFGGLQIGGQIGAAEAEDRLLRIADDEQPRVSAFHENAAKDVPLQRVGVLEFIDDAVTETARSVSKKFSAS